MILRSVLSQFFIMINNGIHNNYNNSNNNNNNSKDDLQGQAQESHRSRSIL